MTEDAGILHAREAEKRIEGIPLGQNIGELLRERAAERGDQLLAHFFQTDDELSYSELNRLTDQLADRLVAIGIRKGTHVAIMIPNGPDFVLSWFAVAKIGAVMIPVNFNYLSRELEYVLGDSDASYLIIDESCLEIFENMDSARDLIDPSCIVVANPTSENPYLDFGELLEQGRAPFEAPSSIGPGDLLSIQYTSGTTGFPKGCMQSHEYWLRASLVAAHMQMQQLENILITFPMFYLDPQLQFLMAIRGCGTAFIARQHSLKLFRNWIHDYKIHLATITPPVFRALPEQASDGDNDLRYIAAFYHKEDTHAALEKRFNTVARDAFGMTEVGVALYAPVSATHMVGKGTVGLSAPFREVRICDPEGNELPRGETGELCIAGTGMLWGYYKKPAANRESFRGRFFRTGDLAIMDDAGYVYIVGRLKEMIKRSGENVAAVEVQEVLAQHPDIVEAAVIAVPDDKRMEEVKAYVMLLDGKTQDDVPPETIEAHCREYLAAFKVPRYIAYVKEFPRTPSNKIAKNKLIADVDDLRVAAFDRVESLWR